MKSIRTVLLALFFCTLFSAVQQISFGQSVPLPTDRGRLKIVSIPDVKGGANLKVIHTDANTPLRGAAPWIENKFVQQSAIREDFIKDQSDAGMNSIRLIWFEAWQKAYGYNSYTDFNNPSEVAHCLAMLETYVNLASKYGMYCIINFHSAFQRPYDEAYATQFWNVVGAYFKNRTHVAYETANEPSDDFNAWMQDAEMMKHANIYNVVKSVAPSTMQIVLTPNRLSDWYPTAVSLADKLSSMTTIDWTNTVVGYHLYGGSLDGIRNLHKAYPALPTENNFPTGSGANKDPWGGVSLDGDWYTSQTCEKMGIGWLMWAISMDCNCYEGWYANWPLMLNDAQSKGWYWAKDVIPTNPPVQGLLSEAETNYTIVAEAGLNGTIGYGNYGGTTCSNGAYLGIPDIGDEAKIAITVPAAGQYDVLIRVRSGWNGSPTYHVDNYAYETRINDVLKTPALIAGSVSSAIDVDSYYGTLKCSEVNLNAGINYVRIKALNIWQKVDYIQAIAVVDTTPPTAPTGLNATDMKSSRCHLTWTASIDNVGVASYEVFNGSTLLGTATTNSFLVTGLSPATSYSFSIKAKDAANNISPASATYSVSTAAFDAIISYTGVAPVIDGTQEAIWTGSTYSIANLTAGAVSGGSDLNGNWTALWDDANLYLFVNITDDVIMLDGPNWYDDDRVEIFIDAEGDRGSGYGAKDYQYYIRPGETTISETKSNAIANVQLANVTVTGGYRLELKIPFSTLGITPISLNKLGVDVQSGDDDDGGSVDGKLAWYSLDDNSWSNPSLFGVASLGQKSDVIAPSVPTALVTSAVTTTSFTLSWTAASDNIGVIGYEVLRDGVSVGTTTGTSMDITGLIPGISYLMTVKARDAAGNESDASLGLSVSTISVVAEAELSYTVLADVGYNGAIGKNNYGGTSCSNGNYLAIFDAGDEAIITFSVPVAGNYQIGVRVRSGWANAPTYFVDNNLYELRVNDEFHSTQLDLSSVTGTIDIDSYYGTLQIASVYLQAGVNFIRVKALGTWQKVDYVEVSGALNLKSAFSDNNAKIVESIEPAQISISVYPNPIQINSLLNISMDGFSEKEDVYINIISIEGRMVMQKNIGKSRDYTFLLTKPMKKGIYLLNVQSGSYFSNQKLLIY